MSIASAITTKQQQVADCYTSVSNKKGTLPDVQNLTNLPEAINSIPTDSGGSSVLAHNSLNRPLTQDEKVLLRYGTAGVSKKQEFAINTTSSSMNGATYVQPVWFNNNLFCVFAGFNNKAYSTGLSYSFNGSTWTKTTVTGAHVIGSSNPNWYGCRFRWIDGIGMLCFVGSITSYGNNKVIDSSGQFTSLDSGTWSVVGKIGDVTYKTYYSTSSKDSNRGIWANSTNIKSDVKIKGHYVDKDNRLLLYTYSTTPHILEINQDGIKIDNDYASNDIGTAYFVGCTGLTPNNYVFFADTDKKEASNNTSFGNWSITDTWGTVASSYSVFKINSSHQLVQIDSSDTLYPYINIDKSLWRFDDRNNCLVIGTTDNVYVLEFKNGTWTLIASDMPLPDNNSGQYIYNASLSPDKRRLAVYAGDIWHYAQNLFIYDIGSGYTWTIVENSAQNYDSVLAFTGVWANGGAIDYDTGESYEIVKTVLPPDVNVTCTLDMGETNYVPEVSIV